MKRNYYLRKQPICTKPRLNKHELEQYEDVLEQYRLHSNRIRRQERAVEKINNALHGSVIKITDKKIFAEIESRYC